MKHTHISDVREKAETLFYTPKQYFCVEHGDRSVALKLGNDELFTVTWSRRIVRNSAQALTVLDQALEAVIMSRRL